MVEEKLKIEKFKILSAETNKKQSIEKKTAKGNAV